MTKENSLERFLDAQQRDYATALAEIKNGRKQSHWMWYIFPQVKGLGYSSMSQYYGISNLNEAEAYLQHAVLGSRLKEISHALLQLPAGNATRVMGSPDDLKLKSSMTLFAAIQNTDSVFQKVLDKFFNGKKDDATLRIIEQ